MQRGLQHGGHHDRSRSSDSKPRRSAQRNTVRPALRLLRHANGTAASRPATPRRQRRGPRARRARPPRGREHVEAIGTMAFDSNVPMRRDTIFRLASTTKPITAVGAMILVEECKAQARRSGRRMAAGAEGPPGPADDREPARRHGAREAPASRCATSSRFDRATVRSRFLSPTCPFQKALGGGAATPQRMAVRRHIRRVHEAPGRPPARASTGRAMAVPHERRDPGRADRPRLRQVAGRLPSASASSSRSG